MQDSETSVASPGRGGVLDQPAAAADVGDGARFGIGAAEGWTQGQVYPAVGLQTPGAGQSRHFSIQGQNLQPGAGVSPDDESIQQTRASGAFEHIQNIHSFLRRDQPAAQQPAQARAGVRAGYPVMVTGSDERLPDNLVRGEDFRAFVLDQGGEAANAVSELVRRLACQQP